MRKVGDLKIFEIRKYNIGGMVVGSVGDGVKGVRGSMERFIRGVVWILEGTSRVYFFKVRRVFWGVKFKFFVLLIRIGCIGCKKRFFEFVWFKEVVEEGLIRN